jgi:hypothetical protein
MSEPNKRLPYPSDLSDKEWEIIEPLIPTPRFVLVVHGECCHTIFHIGKLSTTISVFGRKKVFGNVLTLN